MKLQRWKMKINMPKEKYNRRPLPAVLHMAPLGFSEIRTKALHAFTFFTKCIYDVSASKPHMDIDPFRSIRIYFFSPKDSH